MTERCCHRCDHSHLESMVVRRDKNGYDTSNRLICHRFPAWLEVGAEHYCDEWRVSQKPKRTIMETSQDG